VYLRVYVISVFSQFRAGRCRQRSKL